MIGMYAPPGLRPTYIAQLTLEPGAMVHIQGIPFFVVGRATIEGHRNNFEMAGLPRPETSGSSGGKEGA